MDIKKEIENIIRVKHSNHCRDSVLGIPTKEECFCGAYETSKAETTQLLALFEAEADDRAIELQTLADENWRENIMPKVIEETKKVLIEEIQEWVSANWHQGSDARLWIKRADLIEYLESLKGDTK